ncbi:MAG: STAS-like domain-containing protein [Chloroflexi bacterium]|nr:STAS-like domain-containing protein [Chloroflexota bacterium]
MRQPEEVSIDFIGVEAVTPSFLDALLRILSEEAGSATAKAVRVTITNLSIELSSRFAAMTRFHGFDLQEAGASTWVLAKPPAAEAFP